MANAFRTPFAVCLVFFVLASIAWTAESSGDDIRVLKERIDQIERERAQEQRMWEEAISTLRAKIAELEKAQTETNLKTEPLATQAPPESAATPPVQPQASAAGASWSQGLARQFQSLNPDVSAIVDTYYHADDSDEGISHLLEEMSGFGHSHGEEEHHHHGIDEGFNIRHLELQFSAEVDPYFKGSAIAAIDLDGAEMETAEIETTCLPWGLSVKGGKFFSDFDYINAQHSHQWDFVDQPLIYQLALGSHGLNEKGLQVSWLAPTPFYLLAGVEAFQGDNEVAFAYHGDESLPTHDGPRLGVAWIKAGPNLPGNHALQVGLFGAAGKHQEEHDGDGDGVTDHWLDGDSRFWGADCVYKFNSPDAYGRGDWTVQAEYFNRRRDLDVVQHDLLPALVGENRLDEQDGYYIQAVHGICPRWRCGLRWEQVGLANTTSSPDGSRASNGGSHRLGGMIDFTPSEFSRLRLQCNHGRYETEDGEEDAAEVFLQWMVSLGAHGAHKF